MQSLLKCGIWDECQRTRIPFERLHETPHVLLACKNRKAVESLFLALSRYSLSLYPPTKFIYCTNGPNIPIAKILWENVLVETSIRAAIRSNVEGVLKVKKRYRELRVSYSRGLIFAGPPG
ncbi:MAG: hypothetical protein HY547_04110 [Elusimicrobia bacterium]|nr:hypothetical protein [Elusimicrobiota bacterium]